MKLLPALAIATITAIQPAHAFGPAAMGRDLMYTASVGRATDESEHTRAGFVRPNLPHVFSERGQIASGNGSLSTYSHSLGIVVGFVIANVFAKTADALDAGAKLGSVS